MCVFAAILILHIVGATATAAAGVCACVVMVMRIERMYRAIAILLGTLAAFEVGTGVSLAVMSSSVTIISLCSNIALYLASVSAVQILVYVRLRQVSQRFPLPQAVVPVAASVAVMFAALAFGF